MATVFETGDTDISDNPGQVIAIGDTFAGTSAVGDTNDAVLADVTAGLSYTITLSGLPANSTAFTLFFKYGFGLDIQVNSTGPVPDAFDTVKDLEITPGSFSFSFTAIETGPIALGHLRSDWAEGAVGYQMSIEDFVHSVSTGGDDEIWGSDIAQTLNLGLGNDRFIGGTGDDFILGNTGADSIQGGHGEDVLRGGADDDHLHGGQGNDRLNGGSGNDRLRGGSGEDLIQGHTGNDLITGGKDDDTLEGGAGNDRIQGGSGADSIKGDQGNDRLNGNHGNDVLYGGSGKDLMSGGDGDDTLDGGRGQDHLTGGAGADVFVFGTNMQKDAITDFEDDVDMIDLSAHGPAVISSLTFVQSGDDARIVVDAANFVVLRNFDVADLDAGDFIFV